MSVDFYYLKGICSAICNLAGIVGEMLPVNHLKTDQAEWKSSRENKIILNAGEVDSAILRKFDIRQPVFFADIYWDNLLELAGRNTIVFFGIAQTESCITGTLHLIVEKSLPFENVEKAVHGIGLQKLRGVQLFDIFESEKLGKDKKSLAISFTFLDNEKTLTDKEIDGMMNRIMKTAEEELKAEIRK